MYDLDTDHILGESMDGVRVGSRKAPDDGGRGDMRCVCLTIV